jgi:integrase
MLLTGILSGVRGCPQCAVCDLHSGSLPAPPSHRERRGDALVHEVGDESLGVHDLRHTHKTWLIEDDIPEVAQAKRLGHRLPGVRGIYSHVTPAMNQRIIDRLQDRWSMIEGHTRHAGDEQAA